MNTTANVILSQIRALDRNAMMAWGARDLMNTGDGLKFKTSGLTPWKGYVYVKYNRGSDLYRIEFFRLRKLDIKVDHVVDDVFAENLVTVIDNFVG